MELVGGHAAVLSSDEGFHLVGRAPPAAWVKRELERGPRSSGRITVARPPGVLAGQENEKNGRSCRLELEFEGRVGEGSFTSSIGSTVRRDATEAHVQHEEGKRASVQRKRLQQVVEGQPAGGVVRVESVAGEEG